MREQINHNTVASSQELDPFTWIILAGLLVLAGVVGAAGLAITSIPPQVAGSPGPPGTPQGSAQPAPQTAPPAAPASH